MVHYSWSIKGKGCLYEGTNNNTKHFLLTDGCKAMYPSYSETYLAESSINQIHLYLSVKQRPQMPKVRWWPLAGESKKMTLTPIFPYDKHSMVYDSILDL